MRPYLLFALSTLLAMQGETREMNATDTQRFIDELIANPPPSEQVEQAATLSQEVRQRQQPEHRQWAVQLAGQRTQQAKPVPQALYFVSFSIPEEGLRRLVMDADAFGIPATLRGMVKGDMRETANAVLRLVNEDKRGGVQIDPKSFVTYGINAVPALVVTCDGHYDRIAGNLALREALTKVAESGDCADTAKAILAAHP
jgi:conjugal transfer pilus assembly protein TrbC